MKTNKRSALILESTTGVSGKGKSKKKQSRNRKFTYNDLFTDEDAVFNIPYVGSPNKKL